MSFFDHLMMFDSAEDAFAAMPQHAVTDPDTQEMSWNPHYAFSVQVQVPDGAGGEVAITKAFVWIGLPAPDPVLRDLAGNACRLIADREAARAGQSFLLHRAPDLDDAILAVARFDRVLADTPYRFGQPT